MEEKIAEILQEVYKINPDLKKKEGDLVRMLEESLKMDPELEVDKEFVREAEKELMDANCKNVEKENKKSFFADAGKRIAFSLSVAAFTFVVILICSFLYVKDEPYSPGAEIKKQTAISSKVSIARLGGGAFGVLSDLSAQKTSGEASLKEAADKNIAGAGDAAAVAPAAPAVSSVPAGMGGGGGGVGAKVMPPYRPTYYSYVYKGADFLQSEEKMDVLKRVVENNSEQITGEVFSRVSFGLFDAGSLNSSKLANISIFEDRDYGYRVDADLLRGTVSFYKNWEKWPNIYENCSDENCYNDRRIKESDVPSDEEIIAAGNGFLKEYNVDLSAYGNPEIDKRFRRYYSSEQDIVYPEEISLIYPLFINEKGVYESYGDVAGLSIAYSIRDKKISSLGNLMTQNYQSSAYDAEIDVQKILARAENIDGGMPLAEDKNADFVKVEVELDTPVLGYEHFWRYEKNGQSSEFLVPCFVFPIKNTPAGYWRERVVVPVIKDFLDQNNGGGVVPMMKGAAAGNAGSGGAARN